MKVVLSNIEILDNWKTFVIHFFLLPLLNTAMFFLLNRTITGEYDLTIIATSITLSGSLTAMNQMAAAFVNDTFRGIDRELARRHPFSGYYWGSKALIIFLFSFALVMSNLIILKICGLSTSLMMQSIKLSPLLIIYGLIIGATTAILGWGRSNPYAFSNVIAEIALILAGIIAPYQQFPPVFRWLTYGLPYARTMMWFFTPQSPKTLAIDSLIAILWLVIGVIVYTYKVHHIGKFQSRTMI